MEFSNVLNDFVLTVTGDFMVGFVAATVLLVIILTSVLLMLRGANLFPRYGEDRDHFEDDEYWVADDGTVVFDGEKLLQHLKEENR
jgi:hypothetical protein